MHAVITLAIFKKEVVKMARQKNAMLFHCYIQGDIFKIASAKKVQQFDFSNFKNDKKVGNYILNLNGRKILFKIIFTT